MAEPGEKRGPFNVRSIQSLFLGAMVLLVVTLSLPLLIAGVSIINSVIEDFGVEILHEELQALLDPVDLRYQTLERVGLEDSINHRQEIRETALQSFFLYRYKQSGNVFVIGKDMQVILDNDGHDYNSQEFQQFFAQIASGKVQIDYVAHGVKRVAVAVFYGPWQSYIGIRMDKAELFAPRDFFLRLNLVVLAIVVAIGIFFVVGLNRYIISPIVRLTDFANKVSTGVPASIDGRFVLEFADMRDDIVRMVAALKSREVKYRAIFDAPSDGLFIHDGVDGRCLEVNQGVFEMFGYQPSELIGQTVGVICAGYHPYTLEAAAGKVEKALREGPQRFEWHSRKKDGTLFWTEVSLRAMHYDDTRCVLAVVRDVDDHKRFAEQLAAEKEQLAITLRSIADGVITTDNNGRVVLINKVAEKVTGWGQDEAAGKALSEVFRLGDESHDGINTYSIHDLLTPSRDMSGRRKTILVGRDGAKKDISHSVAPIYDPDSQVVGVVVVFRDITDQKRLEQELHKVKKLESVGILAGGIAHDFNNILAAILGNMNLARMHIETGSKADHLLEQAEKASLRAQNLTRQLLTFSKGGEPVLEAVNLAEVIEENANFVLRGSPVRSEFIIPPDLLRVAIDPGQIGQVIQNIILNARQAMADKGGTIQVACENCKSCAMVGDNHTTGCVKVIIKDDGPGMAPEIVEKIFDPYFSTKDEGSGLGLAISHSIIQKHGGVLSVESTPGQGTTFTIKLPAKVKHLAVSSSQAQPVAEVPSARILLMDDEEMIRSMASQMLQHLGHTVSTSKDGEQALEIYQQAMTAGKPFDLVIMDLTIPGGMGGQEAAKELLRYDSAATLVVASGYSNDPVMANYQEYGFAAMLNKPFRVADLKKIMAEVLGSSPGVGES